MTERKGTKALEIWCKRLVKDYHDVHIENMTTSWRNGLAFCALVHHFRPDLIDMSTLKPENVYENNQLAFSLAEKHLGIPSLLDPEDMVDNDVPDRLSVLTYLSQFYQRLGHTVNTKASDNEPSLPSPPATSSALHFGKAGVDKCAACGLPVYLAQRLIVSHKLYHRRCFRCSKCFGHLNPKNYNVTEDSEFFCDSCKNENTYPNLNNNDQMGMLLFDDNIPLNNTISHAEETISSKQKARPQSILEKISMFENNEKSTNIEKSLKHLSIKTNISKLRDSIVSKSESQSELTETNSKAQDMETLQTEKEANESNDLVDDIPDTVYRSNPNKFSFLQTQLSGNAIDLNSTVDDFDVVVAQHDKSEIEDGSHSIVEQVDMSDTKNVSVESNITDDKRICINNITLPNINCPLEPEKNGNMQNEVISVPPRKKKNVITPEKVGIAPKQHQMAIKNDNNEYPDDLNPFTDEEEDEKKQVAAPKKLSTNPFGSSDEEDDKVPPIPPKIQLQNTTPRRLIAVSPCNPFWSDGEEPSSDEEAHDSSQKYSSLAMSTPNLPSSTPRRKKVKAPPPPSITVTDSYLDPSTSMDDVASISSVSSYNSTAHSDHKSFGKLTPRLKKRLAPTPPLDGHSLSTSGAGSMEREVESLGSKHNTSDGNGKRVKGPAPGLPLPERREIKMQMSPKDLQVQLDLLETQQLGLERQGVMIEQMIRDKCEGDEATSASVPQEEVEDLVIQLCELVNEKNDLFRKQTELMYIRRQQRLEQEQADIEHEIRVIQSRPAVNRIDADKAREEQLVSRLVQIVRMRDELVQQIDSERRRERQEDHAIAVSIATKRAQRNSESNSSSIKSGEVVLTPKKNKVRDKVKKQLKKAKHTLIPHKKKDDASDRKDEKPEKEKKSK